MHTITNAENTTSGAEPTWGWTRGRFSTLEERLLRHLLPGDAFCNNWARKERT
jgi:hypothetical protein